MTNLSLDAACSSVISLPRPSFGSFFKETHKTSLSDTDPIFVGLSVKHNIGKNININVFTKSDDAINQYKASFAHIQSKSHYGITMTIFKVHRPSTICNVVLYKN